MNKMLRVAKNEIITILSRSSFWIAALGIPLAAALIFAGIGAIQKNAAATQTVSQIFVGQQDTRPEGYVDLSGILREIPESVPTGTFIPYPDEAAARLALESGKIAAFYVVSEDYLQTGKIRYIRPDFNPLASNDKQSSLFIWVVQVNLAGGDWKFANLVNGPLKLDEVSLAAVAPPSDDNPLAYWMPYAITLLFYMLIMG
jgi:ABC-type Na+ efflux pump permease subunit